MASYDLLLFFTPSQLAILDSCENEQAKWIACDSRIFQIKGQIILEKTNIAQEHYLCCEIIMWQNQIELFYMTDYN